MKQENHTAITEFEVIAPTNDIEVVGWKLKLSAFGEYCPDNSLCGYSLLHLLDHPKHYRVTKIMMKGKVYNVPADRKQNMAPTYHPETMKYYLGKISDL